VRFVKRVLRKRFPVSPDFFADGFCVAVLCATIDEFVLHLIQHRLLLFTHRLPQHIGITFTEARKLL
jgi:hypothetical protein